MLVSCKECGREISDTAKQCPHCGAKVQKAKKEKEEIQRANLFQRAAECVTRSKKSKRIYLGSIIASCAMALCFLILTILSFAVSYTFLYSKPCRDGYALIDELVVKTHNEYEVTIGGDKYKISRASMGDRIEIIVNSQALSSGQVQYHFAKDGKVTAYALYRGYECDYEVRGTNTVFVKAYKDYKPTTLTNADRRLADTSISLAELVFDYVLASNDKDYDFHDILEDYSKYHDSLKATQISGIVLMVFFSVISVCGIVFYVTFIRKGGQTIMPQNEANTDNEDDLKVIQ